jgi:hypothetical protein
MSKTTIQRAATALVACAWAASAAWAQAQAPVPAPSAPAAPATSKVVLVCEAVYLPARNVWVRTVAVEYDQKRVLSVQIDGVPVYTFNVRETVILTALDNERIQIDTATQTWTSNFRGVASSQGRCERARS